MHGEGQRSHTLTIFHDKDPYVVCEILEPNVGCPTHDYFIIVIMFFFFLDSDKQVLN